MVLLHPEAIFAHYDEQEIGKVLRADSAGDEGFGDTEDSI